MDNSKILSEVLATNTGAIYATKLAAGNHNLIADEPESIGGNNLGASPGDYLCMSLASCKTITLRMYIERKQWKIKDINVKVRLYKEDQDGVVSYLFLAEVLVDETVTEEQKQRLGTIAKACPISKLLSGQNKIETTIVNSFSV